MNFHAEYFERDGKRYVVLPADEFKKMQELLEDAEDILDLEQAISEEQHIQGFSLEEVQKKLGL